MSAVQIRGVEARGMMLEREHELDRICAILQAARGGDGQLLIVEGLSGIGKSMLLDEASKMAQSDGMAVLKTRGGELERRHAWGTVLRLFDAHAIGTTAENRTRLLRGSAALAEPLLAADADIRQLAASDEFALFHGLYWATVNLLEDGPAVMLVDDAHWADELSLRFFSFLGQRLDDLPLAMIVAVRTGERQSYEDLVAHLTAAARSEPLRPSELSLDAAGALLAAEGISTASSPEFALASWEVTRGNPFLLRELTASLRDDVAAGRKLDPTRLANFAPRSVGRSVVLRLNALGEDAACLARACAVLGDGAPFSRVQRLSGLAPVEAADAAARLLDAQFLSTLDPISFSHPIIRTAINSESPPGTRSRQCAAAARVMHDEGARADDIAPLLIDATPMPEPWPKDVLHEAARSAARKGVPQTAVQYLRRALSMCSTTDRPVAMLIDLGLAEAAAGETTSLMRFEEALEGIHAPADEARALYALGHTLHRYGRHAEAAEAFARGEHRFQSRDPEVAATFAGASIAAAWFGAGDPATRISPDAMERLQQTVAEIAVREPTSAPERVLLAVAAGLRVLHRGVDRSAAALARQALDGDEAFGDDESITAIAVNLALIALIASGKPGEASRAAERVLADARGRGDVLAFAQASAVRALALYAEGRLDDAMADAHAAVAGTEHGWGTIVPIPHSILVQCLIDRGDLEAAADVLRSIEEASTAEPRRTLQAFFHWARGRLHAGSGDPRAALDDYLEAGRLFTAQGMNPSSAACGWRCPAAVAAHAIGDDALADRLLAEDLAINEEFGLSGHIGATLHAMAMVQGCKHGMPTLEDAIARLETADMPLEQARALLTYGSWLRRAGRKLDSRDPLRQARELAHRCGARVVEDAAYNELLASGARPRRVSSSGADALTATERRIAELVAQGRTNRQVAETLFVTINTVEWHLRHVFAKLCISSRAEIESKLPVT